MARDRLRLGLWCLLLAVVAVGCVLPRPLAPSKAFWQRRLQGNGAGQLTGAVNTESPLPPLTLTAADFHASCTVTVTNGRFRVSCAPGLRSQADWLAHWADRSLAHAEQGTGLRLSNPFRLYLLHLPGESRSFRLNLTATNGNPFEVFPMVLTATTGITNPPSPTDDSKRIGWVHLPASMFIFTHEVNEWALVGSSNLLVLPDFTGRLGFLSGSVHYRTRWFREGFAHYAGYLAARFLRDQAPPWEGMTNPVPWRGLTQRPFTKLAKVGTDLFSWHQNSPKARDGDNYDAALGLFLLLEQRGGPEAIRGLVAALPALRRPDGPALLRLCREKLGLDLRQMVREFAFPDLGLEVTLTPTGQPEIASVRPRSPAASADLRPGDVLQSVNDEPTRDVLEYECRLVQASQRGGVRAVTLTRAGRLEMRELPAPPAPRTGATTGG